VEAGLGTGYAIQEEGVCACIKVELSSMGRVELYSIVKPSFV